MINLIKMNLYKLFRQKAFYIVPISMAITCCFMVYLIWLTPRLEEQAAQMETKTGFHAGIVAGSTDGEPLPIPESFDLTEFEDQLFESGILIILISVGAAIIANAEQKHGFIKNLAGQVSPRGMLAAAKLPGMLIESFLILAASVISSALMGRILYDDFTLGNLSALAGAAAVQLVLSLALCALILMICTLAGNAAAGIITGIALSMGITPLLYMLIDKVLWNYFHVPESFDIYGYSLSKYLTSITSVSVTDGVTCALAVGAAYLAVCTVLAYMIIKKKDIV